MNKEQNGRATEFDLEVFGYSGRLIDDHVFESIKKAIEYFITEYGGDGGISFEIYERDTKSGNRWLVEPNKKPTGII